MTYLLHVKEENKEKKYEIKAENEELAIYKCLEDLQLIKGIKWLKSANKRICEMFSTIENQLIQGKTDLLGDGIILRRVYR